MWSKLVTLSLVTLCARAQDADFNVTLVDIADQSIVCSITTATEALPGTIWLYLTTLGQEPSINDVKSGLGALGLASCRDLALSISTQVMTLSLTACGLTLGDSYSLQAYFEGNGTRLLHQNFTVPPEPSPLPSGPYCFDIDYDYAGATVHSSSTSSDAEACQALCAQSSECLHFRFTYDTASSNYQVCDLLSSGPASTSASPAVGIIAGPSSCESRAVLYFRPRGNLFRTQPTPIVRGIPVTIYLQGENFDTSYDRIVAIDAATSCGTAGAYNVKGTMPNTWNQWRQLPCNDTGSAPELMICGSNTVLFDELGLVRFCACDAGALPFGCVTNTGTLTDFATLVTVNVLEVTGPYTNNTADCPAGRECTITGLRGYRMSAGDKLMLRENCSSDTSVISYTGLSRPSPDPAQGAGATYLFEDLNTATCPTNHVQGPCMTARLCYCAAAPGSTHSCLVASDFLVDAGEVRFFGAPGIIDSMVILQEDYESFTIRWNYPADDGGGEVTHYNLFFRTCPGGNYTDSVETEYLIPLMPGENRWGKALNATYHFREPVVDAIPQPILPATRYCVVVLATNGAATGRRDIAQEFVWVTDVFPPKDLSYPDLPLYVLKDMAMTPCHPSVTTADCRTLPSVANTIPQLTAQDCHVQNYDIEPALPSGLTLDVATGVLSGTPTELQVRPQIYRITATNAGGKSTVYITLAVIGQIRDTLLSSCVTAPMTAEMVVTFRTPSVLEAPQLQASQGHPQLLRLELLQPLFLTLLRSTGDALGDVPRNSAIGCGAIVMDVTSTSPRGFPPPTLCHWEDSKDLQLGEAGAIGAVIHMLFQGDATFDNDASYQLLLKVGLGTMAANMELLRLTFFVSEASTSNREVDSDAFGTWAEQLPKTIPMVMSRRVELLPQEDSPWFTGRPSYVAGFNNPLLGEVPAGLPYPEGFPAPGAATCYNFSSYCPTSPHQYVNGPYDSLWYQTELYPFFAVFEGNATLLQEIQSQMLFNPFGTYSLVGVNSFSLTDRFLTNLMNFQLEFSLAPDISGGVVFEEFITACPSSPLRMPLMSLSPVCSVQSGPSFVTCTCESSLPTNHPLLRCDNLRIRVNAGGDLRATITATLRLFATEDWWPGYQPIQWFVQLKSQFGGLSSYRTVRNAGFTVWQDFLMVQTTPELCADECLRRFTTSNPCNSFKYHRVDQDCYLSSYVENTASPLRTDWPGDVFDYYEYQEQVAYALATTEVLVFSGVFFSTLSMEATTFLKPPEPSPPSVDIIQQFFPSYVDQSWLRFRIDLSLVVPIHGQSRWASVEFTPPSGFVAVSLSAMATVPTAMGRGYCSVGRWCRWLLTEGQVLWPGWSYAFELTLKNPPDPARTGQLWTVQVTSPGFVTGPSYSSAAVSVAHPLAIDGLLQGCGVHVNDAKYQLHGVNSSLDVFFVSSNAWGASSALLLRLPQAISFPSCDVEPLTPWLQPQEVQCNFVAGSMVVNFTAPLPAEAAVGLRIWPLVLSDESTPLNVRLESLASDMTFRDACHPAVWSCGLLPKSQISLAIEPSPNNFAFFQVQLSNVERRRSTWAQLTFAVNSTVVFQGAPEDILKIRPPYGFSILNVHSSSLQALRRREQSGQLNLAEVVDLPTAIVTSRGTFLMELNPDGPSMQGLQVKNLYGSMEAGQQLHVNLSLTYPASRVEASLFDVLSRAPGESACANVWGLALEAAEDGGPGRPVASGFAEGQRLAVLEQLIVECNTRAAEASSALSIRFRVSPRALPPSLPPGESLVLALSFPQALQLTEPSPVAEYAAPFMRSTANGVELERRSFQKLGCPQNSALYSLNRQLRQDLPGCAVFLNDYQSTTEVFFNASGVVEGANEVVVRVRNPPRSGIAPNITVMAYRTDKIPFRLVPVPLLLAESRRALVLLQDPLSTRACDAILPPMEAEVFTGSCLLPGFANEVTIGFVAPRVFQAPVAATLRAPAGFRIAWDCNFEATQLLLPGGRTLEFLLAGFFIGCVVNPDGRSISFNITRNIKAVTSWTFFTIHAVNPPVDELPATAEQSTWSLEVAGYAAQGAMHLHLRTFQATLRVLPHYYDATTRPVLLTFTSFSPVPTGGYVVLTAPEGIVPPVEQCGGVQGAVPTVLPALPTQPFRALGTTPDLTSSCEVVNQTLRIAVLTGTLPAGMYELRFIVTLSPGRGALKWNLDSWAPQSCGSCCVRRPHFRSIVGLDTIELLDTAVFYASLP